MNNYAICQELIAIDHGKNAPTELLLFKEGETEYTGFDTVLMDEKSGEAVIAFFDERGVDIPIDFEHSTVYNLGKGTPSPAAGWITGLRYEKGKGLIATVEWNSVAKGLIESKQYKYFSPVAPIDIKTRKVVSIHSVALTNSPKTKQINELLAAALSAESEGDDMPKKKKIADAVTLTLNGSRDRLNKVFKRLIAAEEVIPGVEVDTAELPEEQVAELDEVGQKLEELKTVVVEAAEGTGDETAVEILDMAIAIISGGNTSDEEKDEAVEASKKLAATLCATLGVSDMRKAKKKIDTMMIGSVPVDEFKKLQDQLGELQGNEDKRNAETLIASYVKEGKLNPNDDDQMKWANKSSIENVEGFKTLMASAPVLFPVGNLTGGTNDTAPKTERSVLIASEAKLFDDNPKIFAHLDRTKYLNRQLKEVDESPLSEKELLRL